MSKDKLLDVLLGKAYNIAPEGVAALLYKTADDGTVTDELYDDAEDRILRLDADRVSKLSAPAIDTTELYNRAVKETEGKIHGKWETNIRQAYGVDPEKKLKGDDLLKAAKAAVVTVAANPEQVKMSAEYLALEVAMNAAVAARDDEWSVKFEQQQTEFQRQRQWGEISKDIRGEFMALSPELPKDPSKAARQVDDFVSTKFQDFNFQRMDDGQVLVMKKDGTRYQNVHGNAVFLHELVKQIGDQYFEFAKQPAVGNAGNQNDGRPTVRVLFKDEDEFLRKYSDTPDTEKDALAKAWELQQG